MKVATTRQVYIDKTAYFQPFVSAFLYPQGLNAFFAQSNLVRPGASILDAGCGTGFLSIAYMKACRARGAAPARVHGFDLMPQMLQIFEQNLAKNSFRGVEMREANALELSRLPSHWQGYDLILSASMMEHLPKERLHEVLADLRSRLSPGGKIIVFITRKNWMNRLLIEWLWSTHSYTSCELEETFDRAGFKQTTFHRFPSTYGWLNLWGHILEAS